MLDLLVTASRQKIRFTYQNKHYTLEDLWDMPLHSSSPCVKGILNQLQYAFNRSTYSKQDPRLIELMQKIKLASFVIQKRQDEFDAVSERTMKQKMRLHLEQVAKTERCQTRLAQLNAQLAAFD